MMRLWIVETSTGRKLSTTAYGPYEAANRIALAPGETVTRVDLVAWRGEGASTTHRV